MIINNSLTVYHKVFDKAERLEKWSRYNYENIWFFGREGASIEKGYENTNDCEVRIWYALNDININNFAIGDIILPGTYETDITIEQDLGSTKHYKITTIKDNTFGSSPHIHLGGK